MTSLESRLTTEPTTTSNFLLDVFNWLKEGDYVVIHNNFECARYFHANCVGEITPIETRGDSSTPQKPPIETSLDHSRVIYLNVASLPGLLNSGEWDYYIIKQGYHECQCHLKKIASTPNHAPNSYCFELPF